MDDRVQGTPLRLSLSDNAYDSLNESLSCVEHARVQPRRWKYAVLNLVHAIELLIKQRLHDEHPLLIWENVDRPGKTVSLENGLNRLAHVQMGVKKLDQDAIKTAVRWRNNIMHYEVDLILEEVRENYLLLFEYLDNFHQRHFPSSLTENILEDHLQTAADLVEAFRKEFLDFRGRVMHRRWPSRLIAAQRIPLVSLGGIEYRRFRWGAETRWLTTMADAIPKDYCPDCAAAQAEFHGPFCDQEECPRCGGQLLSCDCEFDDSILWTLDSGLEIDDEWDVDNEDDIRSGDATQTANNAG